VALKQEPGHPANKRRFMRMAVVNGTVDAAPAQRLRKAKSVLQ
jgi:hypothetical protein